MKIIFNNKEIKGLIYNQNSYLKSIDSSYIKKEYYLYSKIIPSVKSEQTSGYKVTFSLTQDKFKLYKWPDLKNPLSELPQYKFVLKNSTDQILNNLKLIYDGDNLFHIEGDLSSLICYSSIKIALEVGIAICLIDENENLFFTENFPITLSVSTTEETITFIDSTLTTEIIKPIDDLFEISFPYSLSSAPTGIIDTLNNASTKKQTETKKYYII